MKSEQVGARVKEMRKALGMKQDELSSILGIGKSALSMIETGRAALSERNKNILIQELNLNPQWIESGEGEIFNSPLETFVPFIRRTDRTLPMQSVPLYNIEGTAGLVPLFTGQTPVRPVDYIHIPNLPKCDGAIYIVGDSMYPLLKSGDIVFYKQVHDIMHSIIWGEMYLISFDIDGDEYVSVKYLQKSDIPDHIVLVSYNEHHKPMEIHINRIRALAFIKASLRLNSLK